MLIIGCHTNKHRSCPRTLANSTYINDMSVFWGGLVLPTAMLEDRFWTFRIFGNFVIKFHGYSGVALKFDCDQFLRSNFEYPGAPPQNTKTGPLAWPLAKRDPSKPPLNTDISSSGRVRKGPPTLFQQFPELNKKVTSGECRRSSHA